MDMKAAISKVVETLSGRAEVRQRQRDQYVSANGVRYRPRWKRPKGVSRRQWKRDRMAHLREAKKTKIQA